MRIIVKAKPNAKEEKVEANPDGSGFVVSVKEPPVRGMANEAIIRALAGHFKVSRFQVRIISGYTSRQKVIEVSGIQS
ncbi:MAG: hypothetical protein A3B99_05055 [Candidatus Yanofskybacteria bacterium RIFCSPHIGHO2_02_FULL_44_12b]|uniref:UPF0235 protein A2925_00620 n=2 Tax=Candidatus Yanofskyibacteriota TaxID=1752733 RepID=A0A1F8GIX8_9BACT|nr:MAG: hypothetical protein UW79_C0023G0006 [Candidatus Yanofskybacteria bacterium GW2011_GWA2_44_9]OGN04248.1 MAG: hypothetical protein A2659_03110 [Candidatus Yanofskybacteria bacterium RIFCSPHIGHO2_01_FULL_44_24]OGN14354.1 MAG: hypothetical protein A3B99_05055 [Candidatus Yanofskybacteria bacterium RIFCSPHIGHO2_02_FULL_44_12b]OGN25355.1 MAG: hypothetical protein A2925_00620 [Candidatus Yanofskybacteria bacterium RIFCSPLOWO2_01_FULL_44_22]